uniref:Uncharacterized protein n=1 Tax=Salix viminalis TaxID=40686 RepID=A0A6N2L3T9_SALVM
MTTPGGRRMSSKQNRKLYSLVVISINGCFEDFDRFTHPISSRAPEAQVKLRATFLGIILIAAGLASIGVPYPRGHIFAIGLAGHAVHDANVSLLALPATWMPALAMLP